MSINVLSHQSLIVLNVTDITSVNELKKEIDDFVSRVKPDDKFSIEVTMVIGKDRPKKATSAQSCGSIQLAITAFEIAIGSRKVRSYLKENDISRSTWYNWKAGHPIGRASLERLIEIAPTQEVLEMLISHRK